MKGIQASPKSAFTLIELLVVVAIIAILAGILLPALGKAKASARKVKCLAQMREVAAAVNQFAYDHKNRYPGEKDAGPTKLDYADLGGKEVTAEMKGTWSSLPKASDRPLFRYIETVDLFECPGDRGKLSVNVPNVFEDSGSSYFYAIDDARTRTMGIEYVENIKIATITAASKKVIVFEPPLFKDSPANNAKPQTKWHTDRKASVIGFSDGHAALTEWPLDSEGELDSRYHEPPDPEDPDERAGRDYY